MTLIRRKKGKFLAKVVFSVMDWMLATCMLLQRIVILGDNDVSLSGHQLMMFAL